VIEKFFQSEKKLPKRNFTLDRAAPREVPKTKKKAKGKTNKQPRERVRWGAK
jgi:hypothetical protein